MTTRKPAKRARKSPDNTPAKVRQRHGGAIYAGGVIGNRGGRPPDAFKALCRELATNVETLEAVRKILKDPNHPAYLGALKWASEHGYGKPAQSVQVTGADGGPVETKHTQVWDFGDGRRVEF